MVGVFSIFLLSSESLDIFPGKGNRMQRLLISALLLSTALAVPASAALKKGDKAPDFSARASLAGKEFDFSLNDALKKGPVVVYFYPSAYTGGCNIEAHTFAENKEKFDAVKIAAQELSLEALTKGGAPRWPETLTTAGKLGENEKAYAVDTITAPDSNPYNAWMRFGGFDFFADGKRAAFRGRHGQERSRRESTCAPCLTFATRSALRRGPPGVNESSGRSGSSECR